MAELNEIQIEGSKKFAEAASLVLQASSLVQPYNNFAGLSLVYLANSLAHEASIIDGSGFGFLQQKNVGNEQKCNDSGACSCSNKVEIEIPNDIKDEVDSLVREIEEMLFNEDK